jgi:uncharacterized membrane protein (DUF106 family)
VKHAKNISSQIQQIVKRQIIMHLLYIGVVLLLGIIIGVILSAIWTKDLTDWEQFTDTEEPEENIPLISKNLRNREYL